MAIRDDADKTITFLSGDKTAYDFKTFTSETVDSTDTKIFDAVLGVNYTNNEVYAGISLVSFFIIYPSSVKIKFSYDTIKT